LLEVVVALIGSEQASRAPSHLSRHSAWRPALDRTIARAQALFTDGSDFSIARRLAGAAFLIRVVSALIAYLSQILLARWMGGFEFGIYVYVWTWVLLIGGMVDLGLGSAAQRFIPEYAENKSYALLRGFLARSRWLATLVATVVAAIGALCVTLLAPWLDHYTVVPLYLACAALPIYGLAQVQSGIARSYNWVNLGLTPTFVWRQVVLLVLVGGAYALGLPTDAVTATLLGAIALWSTTIGQFAVLNRRLRTKVESGPKTYATRAWFSIAAPIFLVETFYQLLTFSDVIVLKQFVPPDQVAIYYASAKTLALVAFIYFSVAQTIAHKFAEYHVAGDRRRLADFLAHTIRLTFWPSLAAIVLILALGQPLLLLFGRGFVSGYYLMFIIAVGMLARASVGPAERLLNMLGERRACALVYAGSFSINIVLCVLLIPRLGLAGAAIASAVALIAESASLFFVAKIRLGLHCFIFGRPKDL
jgi:O-antigen/teichoic acid export membrane protein